MAALWSRAKSARFAVFSCMLRSMWEQLSISERCQQTGDHRAKNRPISPFTALYALAFMSTSVAFLAPTLVTLPPKINTLVGIERAPASLALVASVGALVAMFGNPFFGRMSDRTASRYGMRRPWMVIGFAGGCAGILPPKWQYCQIRSDLLNGG